MSENPTAGMRLPDGGIDLPTMAWLAEQMPGGFFIYRAQEPFELLYANSSLYRLYGCEDEEQFAALTGNTFRGMVHPDDFEECQRSIERQVASPEENDLDFVEYRIVRRDGAVRWVEDYGRAARFPQQGEAYYVFISDVTQRRREQEEKRRVENELEREKRSSEIKSDFLFNISHDIRTPMNAIMGFSELARRHMDDPARLGDYLEKVNESGRQMLSLIDDLLDMGRLESGRVELHTAACDLREQMHVTVDLFRAAMAEKQLELTEQLELDGDGVLLDANRFRRVMGNLLSNAVKFTPGHGRIEVSARRLGEVSDSGYARYAFTVADNGIGMSEDFMRRMYLSFEREESSTRAGTIGTGLGLSIAKKLVDIMGGTISVQSKKGEGTRATVELPLRLTRYEAPDKTEQPLPERRAEGKRRILLVEDIEINRMLAETILEEAGFLVESVADGCDAVDAVRSHSAWYYDLVLMDIQMPVMNGYEATRAIRALGREDSAALPIIALSANAREEDRRMSMESGMNSHVAKPFDVAQLIGEVNGHIDAAEAQKRNK